MLRLTPMSLLDSEDDYKTTDLQQQNQTKNAWMTHHNLPLKKKLKKKKKTKWTGW